MVYGLTSYPPEYLVHGLWTDKYTHLSIWFMVCRLTSYPPEYLVHGL